MISEAIFIDDDYADGVQVFNIMYTLMKLNLCKHVTQQGPAFWNPSADKGAGAEYIGNYIVRVVT